MGIAAVPNYLGQDFKDTPPGHRFGLYFSFWQSDWTPESDPKKAEEKDRQGKLAALKRVISLDKYSIHQLRALRERQRALAASQAAETVLTVDVTAIAPFTTGLGNEHPLENGFSFLSPYGLPYLPGSGVKGVLRRAAEALIDEGEAGWTPETLAALFGEEPASGATDAPRNRGALEFWDVFPQLAGDRLLVDILNPHHSGYYQNGAAPHDAENPKPVFFLTVPPGSPFTFHVRCHSALLPEPLRNGWRTLLEIAFELAFDWIGFGAKTAVGYGAMRGPDRAASAPSSAEDVSQETAPTSPAGPSRWENVAVSWNKGKRELHGATAQGKAFIGGVGAENIRQQLGAEVIKKFDKGKSVTATITVEPIGGTNWRIVAVEQLQRSE